MDRAVRISSNLKQHAAWLQEDIAVCFDHIYLHEAGLNQECFIDAFGAHVLPTAAGFDDHLVKPVEPAALSQLLEELQTYPHGEDR